MINRRDTVAGLTAVLASSTAIGQCVLTPRTSDGPFYFDPRLVRANITEDRVGVPLELRMRVLGISGCRPIGDARVDVWHSDAHGIYSGYEGQRGVGAAADQATAGKTFLRGTQFTAADGTVVFQTIYPSWYYGRTPHVHFKVFLGNDTAVTSQIYFPDEISKQVFETAQPYKSHGRSRDTFNTGDMFWRNGMQGAIAKMRPEGKGYAGWVDVGIKSGR